MGGDDDLTVPEAAEALGTTPQTVRALLRKGDLRGRQEPWGSRYRWFPSREGVDEFLSQYGRLDGRRRRRSAPLPTDTSTEEVPPVSAPLPPPPRPPPVAPEPPTPAPGRTSQRPFVLRPRGRATVVVVVLGLPLLAAYGAARILPGALWFEELGQTQVLRGVIAAKVELYLLVVGTVALFIGANLRLALRQARVIRTSAGVLVLTAASLVTGSMFASAAQGQWQTFLLWRHRQPFGVTDPIHDKDVGYFVFSLPFELWVSGILLWLIAVAAFLVAMVYRARRAIGFRPARATFAAQLHLAALAAAFLLVVAWRFHLAQYTLELGQASPHSRQTFSGAGYVDVLVRLPGLKAMTVVAVVLALVCLAAPFVARTTSARGARWFIGVPATLLIVGVAAVGGLIPTLVQRFVVDPNPLLSEQPFLERSIAATRTGLGLDAIDVQPYAPGTFSAADFAQVSQRLSNVLIWDTTLVESRMRQLVTDTPYFSPQEPTLDPVLVDGRRQLTVVSARELDLGAVGEQGESWISHRLAYTHGLGLVRFSGTGIAPSRQPRLLDASLEVRQPRIYFGNQPQEAAAPQDEAAGPEAEEGGAAPSADAPLTDPRLVDLPWVVVDTRRPEVDFPRPDGTPQASYHYDGPAGIELSSWVRRAAFAFALGSKELLLSDDITTDSRLLIHRDVHERLRTLAPFIQWDSVAVPLTSNGRIVYVVDGYTTSDNYPYAERVNLGGSLSNYARASVRATVDAFSGRVELYLTDPSEPIARAWAEIFPSLFRPGDRMPDDLTARLRYPADLFDAQATAYETFHTTRPDQFVSDADAWSRPIGLAGPLEVAGGVDFDESDEDDLRLTMEPGYKFIPPPGGAKPQLVLQTYYVPRSGQNLVANLSGWIDGQGRARLASGNLPRDPVTLGPAQVSRLVFATPRVSNLLGLRNLEIRDLDTSSIDAVLLGVPRLLFLDEGIIQIQSLYEGSRGPGAARLIGVTAFLNGRAGFGPDIDSAVRQALNEPPRIDVRPPDEPAVVGEPVELVFQVAHAQRQVVTITSADGSVRRRLGVESGQETVRWVPTTAGAVRVRVDVDGLDGTGASDSTTFRVLSAAPTVRLVDPPTQAVVGEPVLVPFEVANALDSVARVSTLSGIEFTRRYLIRDGTAVVEWTPETAGAAVLLITVHGRQEQTASKKVVFDVAPSPEEPPPPTVALVEVPDVVTVGVPSEFAFSADGCRVAAARIEGPDNELRVWKFPCPASRATFTWAPPAAGDYVLTVVARGSGVASQTAIVVSAEEPP
jgi:uncharacterized membrane protein (UPF0182 family)